MAEYLLERDRDGSGFPVCMLRHVGLWCVWVYAQQFSGLMHNTWGCVLAARARCLGSGCCFWMVWPHGQGLWLLCWRMVLGVCLLRGGGVAVCSFALLFARVVASRVSV